VEFLWRLLILLGWIGIGLLIGRKYRRTGSAVLWFVVFGPIGLLLVAYGELRRAKVGAAPGSSTQSQDLNLPVQVLIDGGWQDGTLQAWATTATGWHGWVHYVIDREHHAAWFDEDQVRRESPADPHPSTT
jgi:hypothetical protein